MNVPHMTASERLKNLLSGRPVDRLPIIEWAPWWDQTTKRWHEDGVPPQVATQEQWQEYFGVDKCLRYWLSCHTADTPRPSEYGHGIMENEADYENRVRPTLFPPVSSLLSDEDFARLQKERERGDTLHFFTVDGPFWLPRGLLGIERHLFSFYDEPALYHRICEDFAKWVIELFHYVFSRFPFNFMAFSEDMSYNNGPMISKALFDEFLALFYKKVIPVAHAYGVPVFIDSDGDITQAVDWYAQVGADGMLPLERQAGVDISLYQGKQPAMAFIGHFDKMCMKHGPDAMRAEFERLLPSMRRGKFIPSVDHQTPPDVSAENYRAYVKLFKEYAVLGAQIAPGGTPCPVFSGDAFEK